MKDFFDEVLQNNRKIIDKTKHFFTYFDDKPVTKGHLLILPIRNLERFTELTKQEKIDLISIIDISIARLKNEFHIIAFNLVLNEGQLAGKVTPRMTIHIIPRREGDTLNTFNSGARAILGKYSEAAMPPKEFKQLERLLSKEKLNEIEYDKAGPNKIFYLGLKALIFNKEGNILTLFKDDKNFIGGADLPGGRCEHRDSDLLVALQREVFEETNIFVKNPKFFASFVLWDINFTNDNTPPVGLVLNLFRTTIDIEFEVKLLKGEKFKEFKWLSPSKLAQNLTQFPTEVRNKIAKL